MLTPTLYFRIDEAPDPARFRSGWREIIGDRLVLDRSVWNGDAVSRSASACLLLRRDPDDGVWALHHRAEERVVVLWNGGQRYELRSGMALSLRALRWKVTLVGAFSFSLSTVRPSEPIRPLEPVEADHAGSTSRHWPVERARSYLGAHPRKRRALAHLWRQHLGHTRELAEDLDSAAVGRAFGVSASTVTGWREELALHVFGERGHQHAIRDLVIKHGLLGGDDLRGRTQ